MSSNDGKQVEKQIIERYRRKSFKLLDLNKSFEKIKAPARKEKENSLKKTF